MKVHYVLGVYSPRVLFKDNDFDGKKRGGYPGRESPPTPRKEGKQVEDNYKFLYNGIN